MDYSPLFLSLKVALIAVFITFFVGILAARIVQKAGRLRGVLDGLFSLPLVLPPTVVGFILLVFFGNNGPLVPMYTILDTKIVFTFQAAVIASTVVAFPLMYRTALGAFEQVDPELVEVSKTLGLSSKAIFWKVILPVAKPGILSGVVLSFARALGEFGATIMLAGNIPGKTQTISTAIYTAVQSGNRPLAVTWAVIIIGINTLMLILLHQFSGKKVTL